jgi:hypothetical protein
LHYHPQKHLQFIKTMGVGCSSHAKTPAERAAARQKREQRAAARQKRKEYKQVKVDALKRERDSWLRNYSARLEKQWWHVGWWPIYEVKATAFFKFFVLGLWITFPSSHALLTQSPKGV